MPTRYSRAAQAFVVQEQHLRDQIEVAFRDTPNPGTQFEDISATKWDEGIAEYFRGTTWRDHRPTELRHHSAALSFFTDKAYRYWLPAFMLAEIENPAEADIIAEGIASEFQDQVSKSAKVRQFSKQELVAIAQFFSHCAELYDNEPNGRFSFAEQTARKASKEA